MAEKTKKAKKIRAKKKAKALTKGLAPAECAKLETGKIEGLLSQIQSQGGAVLAAYRDPWGGQPTVLAALPTDRVEPTPFQRDVSDTHEKRLSVAIEKLGRYLDPIIAVPVGDKYWTPNGFHRLQAMKRLGAKTITALVLVDPAVQYKILALNTEKAHGLREKSLEVIRMYREMTGKAQGPETDYSLEFEEPAFCTLGICYEKNKRFGGGAYHPILKRVDDWLERPLQEALKVREGRAKKVEALDELVLKHVRALQDRGFKSPYLKSFVVARCNPLRFIKTTPSYDDAFDDIIGRAKRFDVSRVRQEDLAAAAVGPVAE